MRLEVWMKKQRKSQVQVAAILGISQGFLSRVLRGKKHFSDDTAAKVEKMTGGKVTFLELQHPRYRKVSNG